MPFESFNYNNKTLNESTAEIEIPQWAQDYATRFYSNFDDSTAVVEPSSWKTETIYPTTSDYEQDQDVNWWDSSAPPYPTQEMLPALVAPANDSQNYQPYQDLPPTSDPITVNNDSPYWQRIATTVDSMLGSSIKKYDPTVPENLGCARFVSAALHRAYGLPIYDANMYVLEKSLLKYGFLKRPLEEAQPGDVIIGFRAPGDHGHAAIYMGYNQIANNNSNQRRIVIDPIDKFYAPDFRKVYAYHLPV